jgi:tetratricopeptide (TPR) repeat protein
MDWIKFSFCFSILNITIKINIILPLNKGDNRMKLSFVNLFLVAVLCLGVVSNNALAQQNLSFIRVSPQATVSQNVGFAKITIDYSRPGVKDREIWGELVPYGLAPNAFGNGKPMPWRAGANENTTITLSHPAKIAGKDIAAGTYSIHMIVQEDEWTIILNSDSQSWGSFFYEEGNDVMRFKVKPQEAHFEEWLMYGFDNITMESCQAYLHWGKMKVPFKIEFDRHQVVLDKYRTELQALPGFNQAAWGAAARYCLQNNINLDEAMTWIDKALGMNGGNNFNNNSVKAGLLGLQGKSSEGDEIMKAAMVDATEAELNNYGYQLMGQERLDEAIKIFKLNIKRHPESWNCYDSLGEALAADGDNEGAKENYEKAYEMAPAAQKARIEGIIKTL